LGYFIGLVTLAVLVLSIGLGFANENWFTVLGLAIVVISSFTSIAISLKNARSAAQARKLAFEAFLPEIDESKSYSFKYTAAIMGVDNHSPIQHLQRQIDEIQRVAIQDEKNFVQRLQITERRIDICLAQIRYHEEATLPKILGQGSGTVILGAILTIVGSVYLAFADDTYKAFSALAGVLRDLGVTL
jgi:hypothetical protein